jgi:DNA-binding MarR family transcriptional regulator
VNGIPELDPVIHAQARPRVTASLAAGNLSTHLRKLEDAGYVELAKTHERRLPVTYVLLTRAGRRAFEDYTAALRTLLASAEARP